MAELKRIGPVSFAKIHGLIMGLFGIIIGALYGIIAMVAPTASPLGLFGIILFPIAYGLLGFLGGLLGAALYNLASKWVGGLEIEIKN